MPAVYHRVFSGSGHAVLPSITMRVNMVALRGESALHVVGRAHGEEGALHRRERVRPDGARRPPP
ncbi:MAG: hypothetical protein IPL19_08930 [Sandaracinaceae bacterium]|nr:hypothetical protein [Sandaracinaceae bacterium]